MRRLRSADAWFVNAERPGWPMHVGGLVILDVSATPHWSFERVKTVLDERLPLVPEFAMKLKHVPFGLDRPVLVPDPTFSLAHHLRRVAVPPPGGPRELAEVVGDLAAVALDRRRPLWELWCIEGLEDDGFALFMKTHHALVDGISGAGLAELLADVEPAPPPRPAPDAYDAPKAAPSASQLLLHGVASTAMSPVRTARWALGFADRTLTTMRTARRVGARTVLDQAPKVPFNGALSARRAFAYTSVPLADVKAVKEDRGVTINDVVLALAAGAVRSWLLARGALPEQPIVASVPMSLRAKNDMERGTKITTLLSSLETHIADPVLRLHAIAEQMRAAKDVGAVVKTKDVPRFSETLTPAVAGLAWRVFRDSDLESRGLLPSNLIVSNVPGSPIPIYSAGALISAMYPVPPVVVGQGLNITVMSYLDSIGIGFLCDGDMIKDPWELADAVQPCLDELR